jgi:uncharacterized membrane protein YtjA (UPF0391 family)
MTTEMSKMAKDAFVIYVVLFICSLFNDAFAVTDYMASN